MIKKLISIMCAGIFVFESLLPINVNACNFNKICKNNAIISKQGLDYKSNLHNNMIETKKDVTKCFAQSKAGLQSSNDLDFKVNEQDIKEFNSNIEYAAINEEELNSFYEFQDIDEIASKIVKEIEEQREENVKYFLLDDEQILRIEYPMPIHIRDKQNNWVDICNYKNESFVEFSNCSNAEKTITIYHQNKEFSWGYVDVKNQQYQLVNDSNLVYQDVFKDVDLQYILSNNNLKENVILKTPEARKEFIVQYKLNGLTARQINEKTIELLDEEDNVIYTISAPKVFDSANNESDLVYLKVITQNEDKLIINIICDDEWIKSSERQYPITIDPDYKVDYDPPFKFNVTSTSPICTIGKEKHTNSSVFLDLRGSDFKDNDGGVIRVAIYGRNSSRESLNCTNHTQYYYLEADKEYELANTVYENGCNSVYLKFLGNRGQKICAKWSPDCEPNDKRFKIGFFLAGDTKNRDFNVAISPQGWCYTPILTKVTKKSVFLDLRGSDFKDNDGKVIRVEVYGRDLSGKELNCTNRAPCYYLEGDKKYELANSVGENICDSVKLKFLGNPGQKICAKWSPDYKYDKECFRIGFPEGDIKNRDINDEISPQGSYCTPILSKVTKNSVYLNLEGCQGGKVNVKIFGIGGNPASKNCTYNTEQYPLELGKKYELWNKVGENKHFAVQLQFTGTPGTKLIGKWSPDYSHEDGCILMKGPSTGVSIRPVSFPHKLIEVPQLSQLKEFPTGCESVSAVMLLEFYGYNITVRDFIDNYLDRKEMLTREDSNGKDIFEGPDPNSAFVGNPYTSKNSFGCYAPVIMKAMNKFLKGHNAIVHRGMRLSKLSEKYVKNGIPVLVWVTMNMKEKIPGKTWKIVYTDENATHKKGYDFEWPAGEHCVVLLGYNKKDYFVNDPMQEPENVRGAYEKNLIEKRFESLGSQAVVVVPIADYTDEIQKKLREEQQSFYNRRICINAASLLTPELKPSFVFEALLYFFAQVTHKGPWDIKVPKIWYQKFSIPAPEANEKFKFREFLLTREDLGNLTYGYLGTALGLCPKTLYIGGGAANHGKNLVKMLEAVICNNDLYTHPNYGDDPNDHTNVKRGIELYENLESGCHLACPRWDNGELVFLSKVFHDWYKVARGPAGRVANFFTKLSDK